ncbi:ATP-binding protein [Halodesulfovibrio marinisediminis]|uniref:Anti-sigma regulatory factor (Ser/Thr protein kinase) n=1 Tax=Halodesulfovibrio marinisediminis DSM 17456 TaxID=1121457 RepID=A0A1N6IA06_9BACT|nr:ATP-binding protein [Halodesulfovibrio marinisediminis]SIO28809.1 Anti-sigma regulatory factor (Ser/Thr protein kinase) [Halodesulfovibrio marinisediminis DSM 17456]
MKLIADVEKLTKVFSYIENVLTEEEVVLVPKIKLVAEELFVNVAMHVKDTEDKTVEIELSAVEDEDNTWKLTFIDNGPVYNPLEEAKEPDLDAGVEERVIGGLGVHLIKHMTDRQYYERTPTEKNVLQIFFKK